MRKLSFDVEMAKELGLAPAIVHDCLSRFCNEKARRNADYHDGFFWVRIPQRAFPQIFPYASVDTIARAIGKLVDEGLVMVGHYDENNGTTNWYATT